MPLLNDGAPGNENLEGDPKGKAVATLLDSDATRLFVSTFSDKAMVAMSMSSASPQPDLSATYMSSGLLEPASKPLSPIPIPRGVSHNFIFAEIIAILQVN